MGKNELLGRNVLVVQKNGYKRFGTLLKIEPNYIVLRYFNGKEELIGWASIDRISETSRVA